MTVCLCDPSPSQHRSEKNLNGLVRQDLQKVTALPRGDRTCTVRLPIGLSGRLRATPGLACFFGLYRIWLANVGAQAGAIRQVNLLNLRPQHFNVHQSLFDSTLRLFLQNKTGVQAASVAFAAQ